MNTSRHRIFIGLELSGYLTSTIPMVKSTIVDNKNLINWVSGKNLHLTLSFIGEIDNKEVEDLKLKLDKALDFKSFNIKVNGTGSFPSFKNPKILWLDIKEGGSNLIEIQDSVEKIASSFKEDRRAEKFVPHITIGRIKNTNKNVNLDLSTFSNAVYSDIEIPVKTVYLFKSKLLESGVEYSIISKYSLK